VSFAHPETEDKGGPESFSLYIKQDVLFPAPGLPAGFSG
jgi:hypothetical protein